MKTKFSVILLIFLILDVSSENMELNVLSISEFKEKYLPDFNVINETNILGEILLYDVARKTSEIIVINEFAGNTFLNYFYDNGNIRWSNKLEFNDEIRSCSISDIGNLIVLQSSSLTQTFNNHGELIASTSVRVPNLLPSPEGGYLYRQTNMLDPSQIEMEIYDKSLNPCRIDISQHKDIKLLRYRFVSENRILAVINLTIMMFSFDNFEVELMNELEMPQDIFLGELEGEFHNRISDYTDKYCGLALSEGGLYILDMAGNLAFYTENPHDEFKFMNENTLIASTYENGGNLSVIDVESSNTTRFDFKFSGPSQYGYYMTGYLDMIKCLNDLIFNNVITGIREEPLYCLILDKHQKSPVVDSISNCFIDVNQDYISIINLGDKPSITVLSKK